MESFLAMNPIAASKGDGLIQLAPRDGEHTLRTEDILETLRAEGDSIALVMLPGIQYFTGQVFDMKEITRVGHEVGAMVGWDLAHAVGNIKLRLHDWDADFAVWCSYKVRPTSVTPKKKKKHCSSCKVFFIVCWIEVFR